ncbi:MAG: hypothetical protein LDL41_24480, partial [Coleofasciculus sp. S288]|nr:hypothetical protein [Coleofasciculus sp. S288]
MTLAISPVLSQIPTRSTTLKTQEEIQKLESDIQALQNQGEFSQAVELLQRAAQSFKAPGQLRNRAITLVNLGRMQSELGQQYQACETLTQAIGLPFEVCEDGDLPENRL